MRSTTTYERGCVVVVNVVFSDATGAKPRPALVVSTERFHAQIPDIVVCPISSQPRYYSKPGSGDCPIVRWRGVGLRNPSTVRISKILAIDKRIIKTKLGALAGQDLERVTAALRDALALG